MMVTRASATDYLGQHHQHASAKSFEGARRLPRAQVNFVSRPSALVSRLCDERPKLVYMACEGAVTYNPLTNDPYKRDGPIEQCQEVKRCPVRVER
jgi:hypothetical protein